MVCSARAWASTGVCALCLCGVGLSHRHLGVRKVRALASHCCDKTYSMRSLLASPRNAKNIIHTSKCKTKTTQHPLDRGLGGVGQRFTVEGARTGCTLQLVLPRLYPGQLPLSSARSLLVYDQYIHDQKKRSSY